MSVNPGATIFKDPASSELFTFDWSDWLVGAATIATSTFTITPPASEAVSILTKDNASIVSGSTSTQVRLIAGTLGKVYTLTNQIITNESPTQTAERSVKIAIRNL